jgi:hypothetical protein
MAERYIMSCIQVHASTTVTTVNNSRALQLYARRFLCSV